MTATSGYRAGAETSLMQVAYVQESVYGVTPSPAVAFKQLRLTSESLTGRETRQRPNELNGRREASSSGTMERSAGGDIGFVLSYGTFDDWLSGLFGGEWTADVLKPSDVFKSFLIEKRFAANQLLSYPGCFIGGASLTMARGQFLSGTFNIMAKDEVKGVATLSTGAYTPAPLGRVMDPVTGVKDVMMDGQAIAAVCNTITLNITNEGASQDFGLGFESAQGMRMGLFTGGGSAEFYFRDFTVYDRARSRMQGPLSFRTVDSDGNAYKWEIPNAVLTDPQITAGGPSQPIMARFNLEPNPHPTDGTMRVTRQPAAG